MSKPIPPNGLPPPLSAEVQTKDFAELYRPRVLPGAFERLSGCARALGLSFSEDELWVLAALDHPDKVQDFLNNQIYYNYDHPTVDHPGMHLEETCVPPRAVLQTGRAHCFEGACFSYAVNYLHGHDPRWLLLEATQDSDHNLILYRDRATGLYGVNAHSGYPLLVGQPARFSSLGEIAECYFPHYHSDHTLDPNDLTLVGYSEPIDLVAKYGVEWMASSNSLWDIYYTYIDDTVRFHYLFDDSDHTHVYPLIRALQAGWFRCNPGGGAELALEKLPPPARELWNEFWALYDPALIRARGRARAVEMSFFALTGTTPLDLQANLEEWIEFVKWGGRAEQLLTKSSGD